MSDNYRYVIDRAVALAASESPAILDYGCGAGQVVALGLEQGLDIHGADPYAGSYGKYHHRMKNETATDVQGRIHKIENGRLPFADASFDVVVSNQVFEHIDDPLPCLREIERVLKPGGAFLALFPTRETAWEGHVLLWFAHWLKAWPRVQMAYFRTLQTVGLNSKAPGLAGSDWPQKAQDYLRENTFYHPWSAIRGWWTDVFGIPPERMEEDYMAYRLPILRRWADVPGVTGFLRWACVTRAGVVLFARKGDAAAQREAA